MRTSSMGVMALVAILGGCCFGGGDEICDQATYPRTCEGNTLVQCTASGRMSFATVTRTECPACVADGGDAQCVVAPVTTCDETFVHGCTADGTGSTLCLGIGATNYVAIEPCLDDMHCTGGACQ